MLKEIPLANASAIITGGFYIVCRVLASLTPDLLKTLGQSWFHTVDFSSLPGANLDLSITLFGFVTAVVLTWVTGYLFALLYNKLAK